MVKPYSLSADDFLLTRKPIGRVRTHARTRARVLTRIITATQVPQYIFYEFICFAHRRVRTHSGRATSRDVKHRIWPTASVISVFYRRQNRCIIYGHLRTCNVEPRVGSDSVRNFSFDLYDRFSFRVFFVTHCVLSFSWWKINKSTCARRCAPKAISAFSYGNERIGRDKIQRATRVPECARSTK